jgi:hypothetical protein
MGSAIVLVGVAMASARGAHELTDEELAAEATQNRALAAYLERNGPPDVAESHFLSDRPPWDDHEVTLYYLDARKEIGFARAWILGRPEIQIERYERGLTDEQVASLASRARPVRSGVLPGSGPADRAEDAARRAEDAAGRVEAAAAAAEHAADRAETVTSKMESAFHRSLRK